MTRWWICPNGCTHAGRPLIVRSHKREACDACGWWMVPYEPQKEPREFRNPLNLSLCALHDAADCDECAYGEDRQ